MVGGTHTELNQSGRREVTCKEKAVLPQIIQILQAIISFKAKKTPNPTPKRSRGIFKLVAAAMSRSPQ